jgi:hypothetical protein
MVDRNSSDEAYPHVYFVFSKYFGNQISYKNARPLFGRLLTSPL